MTPYEMEAMLTNLDARITALERRQDARDKHWSLCARIASIAAVVLGLLTTASAVANIFEHRTDPLTQVFGCTMTVALFLSVAFRCAAVPVQERGA